jgi:polycomb protein EED
MQQKPDMAPAALTQDKKDSVLYTCTWIQDRRTKIPYLCVAGKDALIKVYDIKNGQLFKTLAGHGGVSSAPSANLQALL